MKKVSSFMMFFLRIRGLVQRIYRWQKADKIRKWLPGAIWIIAVFATLIIVRANPKYVRGAAICFALIMLAYSLLFGLQSCRSIFSTWFWTMITVVAIARGTSMSNKGIYAVAMLFAVFICMLTGALANYDSAKLAMNILNTGTTLIVMVANVFAVWPVFQDEIGTEILSHIQFCVNLGVLPYAIVGYMTALFKDIQLYWENHYLGDIPPEAGIVRIQDCIYNAK